jgi:hypothetical protein
MAPTCLEIPHLISVLMNAATLGLPRCRRSRLIPASKESQVEQLMQLAGVTLRRLASARCASSPAVRYVAPQSAHSRKGSGTQKYSQIRLSRSEAVTAPNATRKAVTKSLIMMPNDSTAGPDFQNDSGLPQGPADRHTGTLLMRQTACARRP